MLRTIAWLDKTSLLYFQRPTGEKKINIKIKIKLTYFFFQSLEMSRLVGRETGLEISCLVRGRK